MRWVAALAKKNSAPENSRTLLPIFVRNSVKSLTFRNALVIFTFFSSCNWRELFNMKMVAKWKKSIYRKTTSHKALIHMRNSHEQHKVILVASRSHSLTSFWQIYCFRRSSAKHCPFFIYLWQHLGPTPSDPLMLRTNDHDTVLALDFGSLRSTNSRTIQSDWTQAAMCNPLCECHGYGNFYLRNSKIQIGIGVGKFSLLGGITNL